MFLEIKICFFLALFGFAQSCETANPKETATIPSKETSIPTPTPKEITLAADRTVLYLNQLKGKKVALLVNQTSMTKEGHLVDFLLQKDIAIQQIFAPEHGFRGQADAGEQVKDGKDIKTGLPIISLYGKNKKPTATQLKGIDVVLFDIQDVGARFYTYISSMSYMMEACAENEVDFLVLDRPNPNRYVDGPVLKSQFSSFVGLHPIPVLHGMTVGEYAQMVNAEGWLKNKVRVNLEVIPVANYTANSEYELPIKPSPNLPNPQSIYLYPSLCFFEGTNISVGRGTNTQFQVIGHPDLKEQHYSFIPKAMPGAKYPKHENKTCFGWDLTTIPVTELQQEKQLNLAYLIQAYQAFPDKENFFLNNNFFEKLAGNDQLRQQIIDGKTAAEIRATWKEDLNQFSLIREKYLLY